MAINESSESSAIAEFGELESGGEKVENSHLDPGQRAIESRNGQHVHSLEVSLLPRRKLTIRSLGVAYSLTWCCH